MKEPENIVERAVMYGGSGRYTVLAERLEKISGQHCSKQMVWNWRQYGEIPAQWVWPVYRLTEIPVDLLLKRKPKRRPY